MATAKTRQVEPPLGHSLLRASSCLVAALLAASAGIGTAATLSYEDARATLRAVSDRRKADEAAVNKRDHEARAADSLGLPNVFLNATQVNGIKTGNIPDTPLGTITFKENFAGPRASINATWSIYSGGRISAAQRALAAGVDEARAELVRSEEQLDLQLAQAYFGLGLAENVARTRTSILQEADRQLDRAVRFEQQGLIPKVERLNAQVARDEAAREQVRAQRDREIAQARLQRFLHMEASIEPSTPLFVTTGPIKPLPEWLAVAERDNPVLAALAARREQAQQGIDSAQSKWKPEVFAFGTYSFVKHYQTLIEPDWATGIGVNFTLFSREDRGSQVSAARESVRQVQSLEAQARSDIYTAVESAYLKVEQAREQFNLLDSALGFAQENLRLRQRGFDEGQATTLDVNDARNALARAETARAATAFEFVVALAQLLEVCGQARTLPDFVQQGNVRLQP